MAPSAQLPPSAQCRQAVRDAELGAGIPAPLMTAIATVESGRRMPNGTVEPWPWSIDAEGVDHIYDSKAEAIAAVRQLQRDGVRSIDVGCMQINLMYHPEAFDNLDEAFDPAANARYAARLLLQLHAASGNWTQATAAYHSATPELGSSYARKVLAAIPGEAARDPSGGGVFARPMAMAPVASWPGASGLGASGPGASGLGASGLGASGPVASGPVASGPGASGLGAISLSQHPAVGRLLPLPQGAVGRGLAAYRSNPVQLAFRPQFFRPPLP